MAGRIKTVIISTDGLRDFVTLPDGVRLILGTVSMSRLVATCVSDRKSARVALDAFLEQGEAMVAIDLDKFEALVQPRRSRWSSIPLVSRERRTQSIPEGTPMTQAKMASATQVATLNNQIGLVEHQLAQIVKRASARMPTEKAVEGLRELAAGLHFYNPGDQSKNDAWNTPGGKVDTVDGTQPSLPADVTNPKTASTRVLTANADLAESIISKVAETNDKIVALVNAGRRFNADQAKLDLHQVASEVQTILTEADLAMPYVGQDLHKLAAQADALYTLFASAKV